MVAAMAWFGQNRTLAFAAAALGLYALHLLSIRFLLVNQRRQRQVLDAQWEVLQRLLGDAPDPGPAAGAGAVSTSELELVPPMPIDRVDPERITPPTPAARTGDSALERARLVPPIEAMSEPEAELDAHTEPARVAQFREPETPAVRRSRPTLGLPGRPSAPPRRKGAGDQEVPVPRHFALGTVALVRNLLTPEEVARILLEQRRQPGKKFGILAVEMGLLTETQREALLLAQQEGLFTDAEMREARQRLREFRESAAHSLAGLE